jgi:hypothetical protein
MGLVFLLLIVFSIILYNTKSLIIASMMISCALISIGVLRVTFAVNIKNESQI